MRRLARPVALGSVALAVVLTSCVLPRAGRGQDEAAVPKAPTDLLRTAPFDRVTLTDGKVYDIEPILPRPLPAYDPEKDTEAKEAQQAKKKKQAPHEENVFLPGDKRAKPDTGPPQINELTIHLVEGDVRDFKVRRSHVKSVEYFEDMLLAEAERARLANQFARAFECTLRVRSRNPSWPGLDEQVNRLLLSEGSAALLDGEKERGLRLLRELHARQPNYPGLADRLADAYVTRIARAFELGLYSDGRRILHEVEALAPDHPTVREARERFINRAKQLEAQAARAERDERLPLLAEALRVWPNLDGADVRFAEAFRASPTLDVGVLDVPRSTGPWGRSPADARVHRLLYRPVVTSLDEDAMKGPLAGQLAEAVELGELGRRISIRLRTDVVWSDRSRPVSAIDVARSLTDRIEPTSPAYQARWADVLERVETPDEFRVDLRLSRPLLKPAWWLMGPVGPAHAASDGRVATLKQGLVQVGDGPYHWNDASADRVRLKLNESAGGARPQITRLNEHRISDTKAALGALVRGEVSLLDAVSPRNVAALAAVPEIKVGKYARPSLHWIALDGRNPMLRNRSLRRGLSYGVDRRTWLEETILGRPPDGANTPSDGPFAKGSYADAPDVKPFGYDPLLARMLIASAKKELGGRPLKFTFEYPARAEAQALAPKLAEALRLLGVELVLRELPESRLEAELRTGRRFDLAYRVSRCDEPVLEAGTLICPGYDASPSADALGSIASPRILQLLLELERAPEWPTARGLALEIDRECRDELPIIPLWQLEDHYAWRTRLKGPPDVAEHLYQGIESWTIEPWFAKDSF